MICLLVGCASSEPTVELTETGGFSPGAFHRGIKVTDGEVTYRLNDFSETADLKRSDREAIFNALDDIDFLSLQVDDAECETRGADFPTVTVHADLPRGSRTVDYDMSCTGGVFDQLQTLSAVIFERSGYNHWYEGRVVVEPLRAPR